MAGENGRGETESLDALDRVLRSEVLATSERQRAFLRYVVTEALAGRSEAIKAYSVGVDALGRSSAFDPQQDPIVRVEATRLRRNLERYYAGEGREDPWRISLPRGSYVPVLAPVGADPAGPPVLEGVGWLRGVSRRPAWVMGVVAVVALGLGAALLRRAPSSEIVAAALSAGPVPSAQAIEVLPFMPVGDGPMVAAMAGGLTADVVTELTRFRQLRVLSRGHARPGAPTVDARYAVTGEVQTSPQGVVLNARLIDRDDGHVVWAERMARPLDGHAPGQLQLALARSVVGALAPPNALLSHLASRAADRQGEPDHIDSWACIVLADQFYEEYSPPTLDRALDCLQATTAREPGYATAWGYLAYVRLHGFRYSGTEDDSAALAAARVAAERAVQLEPSNAIAQRSLAAVLFAESDLPHFRKVAERALVINPSDADALADIGSKLAYSGSWEEGLALLRRAMTLNPLYPSWYPLPGAFDDYRRGETDAAWRTVRAIGTTGHPLVVALALMSAAEVGDAAAVAEARARLEALMPRAAVLPMLRRWNFPPEMLERFRSSLAKAGLATG